MKKTAYLLIVATIISALSCNKIKKLAEINTTVPFGGNIPAITIPGDTSVTIPGSGLSVDYGPLPEITGAKQFLAQYNTSPSKVNSATLQIIKMTIDTPVNGTFYYLDSVMIYISAPGLPKILGAYNYNVPHSQNSISLTPTSENLKDYFLSDTIYLYVHANFIKVPPNPTIINISTNFNLNANPLN